MASRRTSIELASVEEGRGSREEPGLQDESVPNAGNDQSSTRGGDAHDEAVRSVEAERGFATRNGADAAGHRNEPPSTHDLKANPAQAKAATSDATGWDYVYKRLQLYDQEMIKGYSQDIDNLLIFAGLFSAVLTAFLVEVYTQLQPDNTQLSVQLLSNISLQLQQISLNQAAPASVDPLNMSFQADSHVVAINALWFLSLILALASALLGIFVKQWLREYMAWPNVSPVQHAIQLRKFRYDAFQTWKVPTIVTLVPGLLQLAVVLFFGGLVTLLWPIDTAVAGMCCAAAGLTTLLATLTVLLPLFFETCPYKTPFGWMLLPILRPLYALLYRFMLFMYNLQWPAWLKTVKAFCDYCSDKHADLYSFDGWDHRDLALRRFGRDSESSIATQIHSLLWLASHEEPRDSVIKQCISDSPGPRVRTRSALQPLDDSWGVTSERCLRAYWKAISELLGMPCVGSKITALDVLDKECKYNDAQETITINYDKLYRAFDSLTSFNDTQISLILELLKSGLDMLLRDLIIKIYYYSDLSANSLVMVTLIARMNRSFSGPCMVFLLKTLANSNLSPLASRVNMKIFTFVHALGSRMPYLWHEPEEMTDMLELACSCYDRAAFRTDPLHRLRFWAAVSVVTHAWTGSQRWSTAMSVFGDRLVEALSLWTEPGNGQPVAAEDLRVDWEDIVCFLGHHSGNAPDCSRKVAKFILEAHRRNSLADERIISAFISGKHFWGGRWNSANDVYKHFDIQPTPDDGGEARPSSDPPHDVLLHSNSGRKSVSRSYLGTEPVNEAASYKSDRGGTQANHEQDASNAPSTSMILRAPGTDSGSIRIETREPGTGKQNILDEPSPSHGQRIPLDAPEMITAEGNASPTFTEEESSKMGRNVECANVPTLPASDRQDAEDAEDTLDSGPAHTPVSTSIQDPLTHDVERQDGSGEQDSAKDSAAAQAEVKRSGDRTLEVGHADGAGSSSEGGHE